MVSLKARSLGEPCAWESKGAPFAQSDSRSANEPSRAVTAKIDRSPRDLEEDYAKSDPTPKRGAPATRTNGIKASPCPFGEC